jgi:mRNA-degrading endonuclease RelE of RelBE toxin-antitoxin system
MEFKIIPIKAFIKDLKDLKKVHRSLVKDMDALAQSLKINPEQGIGIGKNCYKIRLLISSKGKGKSGGARVITCVRVIKSTVYLIAIFDKSEMDNIEEKDLQNRLNEIPE